MYAEMDDLLDAVTAYQRAKDDWERNRWDDSLRSRIDRERGRVESSLNRMIDDRIRALVTVRSSSGE